MMLQPDSQIFDKWRRDLARFCKHHVAQTWKILRRVFAAISAFVCIWVVIGIHLYPDWWYGLFWNAELWNSHYLIEGWFSLIDIHPLAIVFGTLCLTALLVFSFAFRVRLLPWLDRSFWWVLLGTAVFIFIDAVLLHRSMRTEMQMQNNLALSIANLKKVEQVAIRAIYEPPEVVPPVDFHYLDEARIRAIYSELEPQLIESQHTVASGKNRGISLGLGTGAISMRGHLNNDKSETSTFKRKDLSSQQMCIALINYSLGHGAHDYTTRNEWIARQVLAEAIAAGKAAEEKAKKGFDPNLFAPVPLIDQNPTQLSPEEKREAAADLKRMNSAFVEELKNANGFVLVTGTFLVSSDADGFNYEETYSSRPIKVNFRFHLPHSSPIPIARTGERPTLRVFGDITQQLDRNGDITIHPLAVF